MTSKTTPVTTHKSVSKIIDPEDTSPCNALKELLVNFCIGFTLLILFSCIFGLIFADEAAKPGICLLYTSDAADD